MIYDLLIECHSGEIGIIYRVGGEVDIRGDAGDEGVEAVCRRSLFIISFYSGSLVADHMIANLYVA